MMKKDGKKAYNAETSYVSVPRKVGDRYVPDVKVKKKGFSRYD